MELHGGPETSPADVTVRVLVVILEITQHLIRGTRSGIYETLKISSSSKILGNQTNKLILKDPPRPT